MSGTIGDNKRLLRVTAGNLRNNHLYVNGHYDFFPPDCIGPSRRSAKNGGGEFEVFLDGLNETIRTDIPTDNKTGRRRSHFRERKWIGRFYRRHQVEDGDILALERLGTRKYRLCIERLSAERSSAFAVGEKKA